MVAKVARQRCQVVAKGADQRGLGCSTPAPRGPTCKFNHPPPCYRDADWPGPIPQYVIDNKPRLAKLLADRDAVAERLIKAGLRPAGAKAVPLKGPSGKEEMIGVLDEAQFDECDDCDDYALTQAQELNDMLQVLEVQPGEDVPGVHMPRWLQQLRGVWTVLWSGARPAGISRWVRPVGTRSHTRICEYRCSRPRRGG